MMRWAAMTLVGIGLAGLIGCDQAKTGGPHSGDAANSTARRLGEQVNAIHTFADPTTVNLDANPDPDGVVMTVYFENAVKADAIAIHRGTLTCTVYDSADATEPGRSAPPLQTWHFTADQLQPFTIDSFLGTGYRMALRWGTKQPRGQTVTLMVHYDDDNQPTISSQPVTITVIRQ